MSWLNHNTFQKADAQAGLRQCCSQTPEDRVSRVEAQLMFRKECTLANLYCVLKKTQSYHMKNMSNSNEAKALKC